MNRSINSRFIKQALDCLKKNRFKLITAESLTGGLIVCGFTQFSGASEVVWGGLVTYSPQAKTSLLGVDKSIIERYGTVSAETARAMSLGAFNAVPVEIRRTDNFIAVSVTGVAGPGTLEGKNAGTVFMGLTYPHNNSVITKTNEFQFAGDRDDIRFLTVEAAAKEIVKIFK